MTDTGSQIHGHIWEHLEMFDNFINTPFLASQVRSHKKQERMFLQHIVPGHNLILIRRVFRVKKHVVLWIFFKILFIVIYGHLIYWEPAIFGFTKMPADRFPHFFNIIEYRIKFWIVNHNKFTVFISLHHSNIFPNLNADCSIFKGVGKVSNSCSLPAGIIPTLHGESSQIKKLPRKLLYQTQSNFLLFLNGWTR